MAKHLQKIISKALFFLLLHSAAGAALAMTPAGVLISNQASLVYQVGASSPVSQSSNIVSFSVAQLIDVAVTPAESTPVASSSPDILRAIAFNVSNAGNGGDIFRLSRVDNLPGDQFDPVASGVAIYLENGLAPGFQASGTNADTVYSAGSNDIALNSGEARRVYVVSDLVAGLPNGAQGKLALHAESTLSGAPGTTPGAELMATRSPGLVTVVGFSRAKASAEWAYVISRITLAFTKTLIRVADLKGGTSLASGATLSYRLNVAITGSGVAQAVEVTDPLPPQMRYKPGTLKVADMAMTDAVDSDVAEALPNQIVARLGDVTAPKTIAVEFDVVID